MNTRQRELLARCDCEHCPLRSHRRYVFGTGNRDAALAIVGEGPGYVEDRELVPFVGPSGELLNATLASAGIERRDVFVTNTVLCRSVDEHGSDAPPPKEAVAACRPRLLAELREVNPTIVLSVGASAAKSLLGTTTGITELEGVVEYPADFPCPVLPTFHPAAVLHGNEGIFDDILASTKRAVQIANGAVLLPPRDEVIPWRYITQSSEARRVLTELARGDAGWTLALDVETSGLDTVSDTLLMVALGNASGGVCLAADNNLCQTRQQFIKLLCDDRFTWIMHNSSFDLQFLQREFGVMPTNVVDTICLALGTTERAKAVGLKKLARTWLNAGYYEKEIRAFVNQKEGSWANVPRDALAKYAVYDVVMTARLKPILDAMCREEGTYDMAYGLLMPAQRAFAQVESHGVLVDLTYLTDLEHEWAPRVEQRKRALQDYARAQGWHRTVKGKRVKTVVTETVDEWFWEYPVKNGKLRRVKNPRFVPVGAVRVSEPKQVTRNAYDTPMLDEPLNPDSPTQLATFLFDHLRLKAPDGKRTTGVAFREAYPDHDFTKLMAPYQLAEHMLSSYVRGITKHVRTDQRVHPNIKIFGAVTGRLAMENPAIQTIPRENTLAGEFDSIKRMFMPSPGHVWLEVDYNALEVRVAWMLSEDDTLGDAIKSGDFHRAMAARMYKLPPEQISDEQRQKAKVTNFGIMYGITAQGLAERIGGSTEAAQALIDGVFAIAPKYREWYTAQHRKALEEGRSQTPFGRVRRWSLITRSNKQSVLNQSVNYPVQSVASDLTLRALIKLTPLFPELDLGHVLFAVHDSLCFEVREGREQEAIDLVTKVMTEAPWETTAILDVEAKVGKSWGETRTWISAPKSGVSPVTVLSESREEYRRTGTTVTPAVAA